MHLARERKMRKTGTRSIKVTWSLPALGATRADPEALLALVRNRWPIETRVHDVRAFPSAEARCRTYVRHLPRPLACSSNAAITLVRCAGRFRSVPEANRPSAARAPEALDASMLAPLG